MPSSNPMRLLNSKRAGFSLIEVMVAMVILTIGLFAVINLQVIAVRGNTFARARTDAQKIAQGVSNEIRTRALGWVNSNLGSTNWDGLFTEMRLTAAPLSDGSNLALANLGSVTTYQEKIIADDSLMASANLIDVAGNTGPGAMYRVHFIAHGVPMMPGASVGADPNLVRVTVLVSWDSKDHGRQDYAWNAWQANYFSRNMVSVTQFLSKRQL